MVNCWIYECMTFEDLWELEYFDLLEGDDADVHETGPEG